MKVFSFIAWWLFTVAGTFLILSFFGVVPQEVKELNATVLSFFGGTPPAAAQDTVPVPPTVAADPPPAPSPAANDGNSSAAVLPTRVVIAKIGVNAPVSNPATSDIATLNAALLSGAVRYPGSGTLDQDANMFIFAHSSGLPIVHNQAFKSFNRLGELQLGDEIDVYSADAIYRYAVTSMRLADQNEVLVQFQTGAKKLTLSTCDNFAAKSARYVVEADFVEKVPITSS